jgi:hypothetical protein
MKHDWYSKIKNWIKHLETTKIFLYCGELFGATVLVFILYAWIRLNRSDAPDMFRYDILFMATVFVMYEIKALIENVSKNKNKSNTAEELSKAAKFISSAGNILNGVNNGDVSSVLSATGDLIQTVADNQTGNNSLDQSQGQFIQGPSTNNDNSSNSNMAGP